MPSEMPKLWFAFAVACQISFLCAMSINLPSLSFAEASAPRLFPTTSEPFGTGYSEWTALWWQWALSGAEVTSTDDNCFTGEHGRVTFVDAPELSEGAAASCLIANGSALLLPIISGECDFMSDPALRTESELAKCATTGIEGATMSATVDGTGVENIQNLWVKSPLFNLTIPAEGGDPGGTTKAVAVGYYIFLEPLPVGEHEVQVSASILDNPVDGTYGYAFEKKFKFVIEPTGLTTTTQSVAVNDNPILLPINSSSDITSFAFDDQEKKVSFRVEEGSSEGTAVVPIGKLLEGPYLVHVDGIATADFETERYAQSNETYITLTYPRDVHSIVITGSRTVPEFTGPILLSAAALALAVILRHRRSLGG
jgi:hypothetical protein